MARRSTRCVMRTVVGDNRPLPHRREPALQVRFVFAQIDAGDADLLEAELAPPEPDAGGELIEIGRVAGHGWRCCWLDWV